MDEISIIESVRHWVSTMVVGLGLCPFAEKPSRAGLIRYTACESNEPEVVLETLARELTLLDKSPRTEIETTLLIAPHIYPDFLDFNDFIGVGEKLLEELDLVGVIQIVGFHPQFRYAGAEAEAAENYTNRSPFPMIHLLREISISEVAESYSDLDAIPKRNTATLQKLGVAGILKRMKVGN